MNNHEHQLSHNRLDFEQHRRQTLLEHCHKIAQRHLAELLRAVFDNVDDTLFQLADKADNNGTQTMFFDAMREVRLKREAMEGRFRHEFSEQFKQAGIVQQDFPQTGFNLSSLDNLQLVGEEELEEQLAITNLANKAQHRFHELIHPLARRLDLLVEDRRISHDNGPLMPRTICHAFRAATQAVQADIRIKLILFKLLDRHVMENLATLYLELNGYLIGEGILPEIKLSVSRSTSATASGKYAPSPPQSGLPDGNTFETLRGLLTAQQGGTGIPLTGMGQSIVLSEDLLTLLGRLQLQALPQEGATEALLQPGQIKSLLTSNIGQLLGHGGNASLNHMDSDTIDLVGMLFDFIFNQPELTDGLKALIGRLQIPLLKVAIIDKSFFSKKQHPARALLNSLAQAGINSQHGDEEGEQSLHAKVSEIVERALNEFDQDINLFNELQDEFNAFLSKEQARYLAQEHERIRLAQAKEFTERARRHIHSLLNERIGERKLPTEIHTLLHEGWHEVLLAIYLTEGEGSMRWEIALDLTNDLLWSLEPKTSLEERRQLALLIPTLLRTLRQGLEEIRWEQIKIDSVFKDLGDIHLACLRGQPINDPAVQARRSYDWPQEEAGAGIMVGEIPMDRLSGGFDQSFEDLKREIEALEQEMLEEGLGIPAQPIYADLEDNLQAAAQGIIEDEFTALVRTLNPGDWIELRNDHGQNIRAKLEWKGDIVGEYIFVNWRYQVVAERTISGLAADFRRSEARRVENLPLMDRALSTVMDTLLQAKRKGEVTH